MNLVAQNSGHTPKQLVPIARTNCIPINWDTILDVGDTTVWIPQTVRLYLRSVVERLNRHFGMIMTGPNMGCVQISRQNATPSKKDVRVTISIFKCSQMYNRKVSLSWMEQGKHKRFHMAAFILWLKSGNRKNITVETTSMSYMYHRSNTPAIKWLKEMVLLAEVKRCPITFDALNIRKTVYDTFWKVNGRKNEWSAQRISQELYTIFPQSRPMKGRRVRWKGKACIDIPSRETCSEILQRLI